MPYPPLYAACGERLFALDADGAIRWSVTEEVDFGPFPVGDRLVFGTSGKHIAAVDRSTGALRWKVACHAVGLAATRSAIVAVTHSDVRRLACDGTEMWRAAWQRREEWVQADVVGPSVVVSSRGLTAFRMQDGERQWSVDGSDACFTHADGALFVGRWGAVARLGLADGHAAWTRAFPKKPMATPRAFGAHDVLVASAHATVGCVARLSRRTGAVQWRRSLQNANLLTVAGNVLLVREGHGNARALDARTGRLLWRMPGTWLRAAASDPTTLLVASPRDIAALDARTGRSRWRVEGDYRRITVRGRRVYAAGDGHLTAIGIANGNVHWRAELGSGSFVWLASRPP